MATRLNSGLWHILVSNFATLCLTLGKPLVFSASQILFLENGMIWGLRRWYTGSTWLSECPTHSNRSGGVSHSGHTTLLHCAGRGKKDAVARWRPCATLILTMLMSGRLTRLTLNSWFSPGWRLYANIFIWILEWRPLPPDLLRTLTKSGVILGIQYVWQQRDTRLVNKVQHFFKSSINHFFKSSVNL